MSETRHSHLPEPSLESFLELLCAPEVAPATLAARLEGFNPKRAGPEVCSLLPLLAERWGDKLRPAILREAGEIRRAMYFKNTLTLAHLAEVLKLLEAAGIKTLVFKGAALISEFYRDPGLRFMEDADVLIQKMDVPKALELLAENGWRWNWPRRLSPMALASSHAIDMASKDGIKLDLHWHPFFAIWHPGGGESFWNMSHAASVFGMETRVLCPTHQLFHGLVHGARQAQHPSRWVVDAIVVLQKTESLDWDLVCREAEQRRFSLTLQVALGYLIDRYQAPIPPAVMEQLFRIPVADWERADFEGLTTPKKSRLDWQRAGLVWRRYRLVMPERAGLRACWGFPLFLQHLLHQPRFSGLLFQLFKNPKSR